VETSRYTRSILLFAILLTTSALADFGTAFISPPEAGALQQKDGTMFEPKPEGYYVIYLQHWLLPQLTSRQNRIENCRLVTISGEELLVAQAKNV